MKKFVPDDQISWKTIFRGFIVILFIQFSYPVYIHAQMTVDPYDKSFGDNGIAQIDLGKSSDNLADIDLLSDGKILLYGNTYGDFRYQEFLMRYNADGTPDATFGDNGIVMTKGDYDDLANEAVVQSDGKIITIGYFYNGNSRNDLILRRYSANGTPDMSFAGSGQIVIDVAGAKGYDGCYDAVTLSDDHILLCGRVQDPTGNIEYFVGKLNADGTVDSTFATDGFYYGGGPGTDELFDLAVQSDGKIIATGYTYNTYFPYTNGNDVFILRFNADGTPDNTFNGGGYLVADFNLGQSEVGFASVVQPDGKIVTLTRAFEHFTLIRMLSSGAIDTSFGTGGYISLDESISVQTINSSGKGESADLFLRADGKFIVAGIDWRYDGKLFAWQVNADGSNDSAFGNNGLMSMPQPPSTVDNVGYECLSVITSDNHIIAGGNFRNAYSESSDMDFILSKWTVNGAVDAAFGTNGDGLEIKDIGFARDISVDISLDAAGNIYLGGYSQSGGYQNISIIGLDASGALRNSWANNGTVFRHFGLSSSDIVRTTVLADGKLLVLMKVFTNSTDKYDFAVMRFLANGSVDSTFASDGMNIIDVIENSYDYPADMTIQDDGKILLTGYGAGANSDDQVIVRLYPDGNLDNTFANSGILITDYGYYERGQRILTTSDSGILVIGLQGTDSTFWDFGVSKYTADGLPDNAFGTEGRTRIDIMDNKYDTPTTAALLPDGKILIGGYIINSGYDFALVRLNSDGTPDNTFGNNGIKVADFTFYDNAYTMVTDSQGRIYMGGSALISGRSDYDFLLARFTADGEIDTTFNGTGYLDLDLGKQSDEICYDMALIDSDSKLLMAGYTRSDPPLNADHVVIKLDLSKLDATTAIDEEKLSPGTFALAANYPNPFNPSTTIRYTIGKTGDVQLVVFDITGRRVATLVNRRQTAGNYNLIFDAGQLASGTYFYQLKTGGNVFTRKMLLIK